MYGMRTTIDHAGRLVIPRAIRHQAGIQPGTVLDVRWNDGRIEIEPVPLRVRLVQEGRLLVAVPEETVEELPAEKVEATRHALFQERSS
jgi:AbrB family looped-hinge helix DNA binding protein